MQALLVASKNFHVCIHCIQFSIYFNIHIIEVLEVWDRKISSRLFFWSRCKSVTAPLFEAMKFTLRTDENLLIKVTREIFSRYTFVLVQLRYTIHKKNNEIDFQIWALSLSLSLFPLSLAPRPYLYYNNRIFYESWKCTTSHISRACLFRILYNRFNILPDFSLFVYYIHY